MKKILAIALIFFTVATVFSQNFEGKITYQNTYKGKTLPITDEKLSSMMGTIGEYYIKGGNYKSVLNGTFLLWYIYINKDNKFYSKFSNSDTILWNDGGINDDSVISFKLNKHVEEILGYMCDELILTCKSGIQKYYFTSKLGIDAKLYKNHKYENWYEYLKLTNAIPLKMIIEKAQFSMEITATEIKPMKLDNKEFQLPENAKTAKSPY
jgi:hypothetical protein